MTAVTVGRETAPRGLSTSPTESGGASASDTAARLPGYCGLLGL